MPAELILFEVLSLFFEHRYVGDVPLGQLSIFMQLFRTRWLDVLLLDLLFVAEYFFMVEGSFGYGFGGGEVVDEVGTQLE